MLLSTHIANRFLTDLSLLKEIMETHAKHIRNNPANKTLDEKGQMLVMEWLYSIISTNYNKNFIIAQTVLDKLSLFDSKKAMSLEGWTVFKDLPAFKDTYILQPKLHDKTSELFRVLKDDDRLEVFHLKNTPLPENSIYQAKLNWCWFYVDFKDGVISSNFGDKNTSLYAPMIYSLLAFLKLSDVTEQVIPAGQRYGTQKTFKTHNIFPAPLTLVNSNWNITTIRGEGFPVKGHAAFRWVGPGRSSLRLVYIAPYEKEGYTRKAGKLSEK